jgi:hypothetical protein
LTRRQPQLDFARYRERPVPGRTARGSALPDRQPAVPFLGLKRHAVQGCRPAHFLPAWNNAQEPALSVAFSAGQAKIRAPGAEDRRLRRSTHGDTRELANREAPIRSTPFLQRPLDRGLFLRFLLAIWVHGRGKHQFNRSKRAIFGASKSHGLMAPCTTLANLGPS